MTAVALSGATFLGSPASSAAQGLTATVAPEYERARWDDAVGLENVDLFGGSASLGFGRYVSVRAAYKQASSLGTVLGPAGYGGGTAMENSVDLSLISTDVHLRLGGARIAPVLLGGGGVLGLSPDGREDVQQVAIGFGGGLDARILPWLTGQVLLKNMRFRLDRSTLAGEPAGGGLPADPEADAVRSSWTVTAALGARLGGGGSDAADRLDDDFTQALSGGSGLMIPVELQASVIRFSDAVALDDQPTLGLRAGFDFGPYFGIRGSYARAVDTGPVSFQGMSTWTGEAQFNVGRVTGWSPHLLLGFGQITFWGDDFRDVGGVVPDDEDAFILGAGVGVPLWTGSRLTVSLRDYITSAGSVSGVSSTSDLRHNFGLSVGLSYNLRGGPSTPRVPPMVVEGPEAQAGEPSADSVQAVAAVPDTAQGPATPTDSVQAGAPSRSPSPADTTASTSGAGYQSDRVVTIPLPTEGQLTIRYGPEARQPERVEPADTDVARPAPADSVSAVTPADLEALEERLMGQLAAAVEQLAQGAGSDSVAVAAAADSLELVTSADLEALETRLTEGMAEMVREEIAAAGVDTATVVSLVRRELEQALPMDSLSAALATAGPTASDSLDLVTTEELEALEARLNEALAATRDTMSVAAADSLDLVTAAELEALETRLNEALAATRDTMSVAAADSLDLITAADLEAMEARLTEMLSAAASEEMAEAAPDSALVASLVQAELDRRAQEEIEPDALADLSAQVQELSRLVRERAVEPEDEPDAPVSAPVNVNVPAGVNTVEVGNQAGGPIFRGISGRLGPSRIRDSGTGFGGALDVSVFELWRNRLHPYVGFRASTVPVDGEIAGAAYAGDVTSVGGVLGASLDLLTVGPVRSALDVGLAGIGGGTSGDVSADEPIVDDLYGGFVMGPEVALDLAWSPSAPSRWSVLTSIARTWAGSRGGWSFHIGFQWSRPGAPVSGRPFFIAAPRAVDREPVLVAPQSGGEPSAAEEEPTEREPEPEAREEPVDPSPPATTPAETPDSTLLNRLSDLERTLQEQRAATDSLTESARQAQERADSLSAAAEAAQEAEREEERRAEERAALRADLEGLIEIVPVVQSVRQTERGLEVVLGGGLFASGSTTLDGAAREGVAQVARVLAGRGDAGILVDGHTDATGPAELNMELSRDRAAEVGSVLVDAGISPGRLEVVGSGEESPLATNDTAEGRALNRRVEIVLVGF